MEYTVIYEDDTGNRIVKQHLRETTKIQLVEDLDKKNIKYSITETEDEIYHCLKVVFDIQKIDVARKAVAEHRELPGIMYTFGDPKKIAKENEVVVVNLTNGQKRNAFVVSIWKATFDEIVAFKNKINYKRLSCVYSKI